MRRIILGCCAWLVLAQGAPIFEADAWGWCRLRLDGTGITDFPYEAFWGLFGGLETLGREPERSPAA